MRIVDAARGRVWDRSRGGERQSHDVFTPRRRQTRGEGRQGVGSLGRRLNGLRDLQRLVQMGFRQMRRQLPQRPPFSPLILDDPHRSQCVGQDAGPLCSR
jgi:hypothetical protein